METLGFHLDNLSGTSKPNDLDYHHIIKYVEDTFETLLKSQVIDFENNPSELRRTVRINDFGVKATAFNLSDVEKTALYRSGKDYTSKFLEKLKTEAKTTES